MAVGLFITGSATMKTNIIGRTAGILFVAALFSGCVMPASEQTDAASSTQLGETRSVILVPVLVLPQSNGDPSGDDEAPRPKSIPPEQSARDGQTQPTRLPVKL
jgi:hypothetical protein